MTAFNPMIDRVAADLALQRRLINGLYGVRTANLGEVEIEVHDGVVVLRGRVPNARLRHLAAECCRHAPGVHEVQNRLVVEPVVGGAPRGKVPGVQPPPSPRWPQLPAPHFRPARNNSRLRIPQGDCRHPR